MKIVRSLKAGDKVSLTLFYDMKTRSAEFHLPERPILPRDLHTDIPHSSLPVR
jgi:hypothetical protein